MTNRNVLQGCDAPTEFGPARTLHNRWKGSGDHGVVARITAGLKDGPPVATPDGRGPETPRSAIALAATVQL